MRRRIFLRDLGTVGIGVLTLGLSACGSSSPDAGGQASPSGSTSSGPSPQASPANGPRWQRVNLGFVSAYVVARAGEATIVDTGVEGSEDAIEEVLAALGLGWGDVANVVLTHRHPDHQGSLPAVLAAATEAEAFAGAADLDAITSPRPVTAVGNGDTVAGLEVVETPGHTAGHISLLHPGLRLLLAGDALRGGDGGAVLGSDPQYTDDMTQAQDSLGVLAGLDFDDAVFGHGEPVIGGAAAAVRGLAAAS